MSASKTSTELWAFRAMRQPHGHACRNVRASILTSKFDAPSSKIGNVRRPAGALSFSDLCR